MGNKVERGWKRGKRDIDVNFTLSEFTTFIASISSIMVLTVDSQSIISLTNFKEVMKRDGFHFRSVHLLVMGEEEPIRYPYVEKLRILPMALHYLQASLVAVTPTKEDARFSLIPGNSPCPLS